MKISALRSATALQKYKEVQNSNDPDFANQVLAHFGIKPKVDSRTSIFIGGDDKTLSINPQVNTNFPVTILRLLVLVICLPAASLLRLPMV